MGHEDAGAAVYKLRFDDRSALAGLTMRVRNLSADELRALQRNMSVLDGEPADDATLGRVLALADIMADTLVEWNQMAPVPPTRKGVRSLRLGQLSQVLRAWRDVAINPPSTQDEAAPPARPPAPPADPDAERRRMEAELLQLPVTPLTAPAVDE